MKEMIVKNFMDVDFAKISKEMPIITASIELIKKEALGGPVIYPCYLKMQSQPDKAS